MHKYGFPRGNPPDDCRKLSVWWQEEMRRCGLSGVCQVEHSLVDSQLPAQSAARRLFEALVMHREAVADAHLYYTTIPGAPWPLQVAALSTRSGTIAEVAYRAILRCPVKFEAAFRLTRGIAGGRLSVEGPFAERFQEIAPLLKKIRRGLSIGYAPPQWGFAVSKKHLELKEASVKLVGCTEGTEATATTTVREVMGIVRHRYTLGLDRIVDIFQTLERTT